ncbi:hypothetical protein CR164_09765 [Prosthecochloris marina]|uniref:Isoprenylcysteine carboxyl methyltransferase n=1 Tax=Prosthecochloris marina TaxID=2017681 RepID=A0A317T4N4_9CHLB|nr:hypothetical protein [Prosthecochloris marina]PWW81682.1 hypothetical protein CR164_09765 [Prosthecochloris marina]
MDPRVALRLPEDDSKRESEARSGDGTMRKGEVGQQYYMKEKSIVSPNSSPVLFPKKAQQLLSLYRTTPPPSLQQPAFATFSWAIFTLSLSRLLLLVVAFLFFSYKADKEEQWLRERHPEYEEYAKRVKKFMPKWLGFRTRCS